MFTPEQLLAILQRLPEAQRYWIAFSGGLDSTVLLHALAQLSLPIAAIYVDHGLSPESANWSEQCRLQCEALGVEFHQQCVEVNRPGRGLEAAAREARYAAFEAILGREEMLLTAHHQDDQAETLLLQLLRGGGVRGLAAMPLYRQLGEGWLGRPLLQFCRDELQAYAGENGLAWIEDPSNFDTSLERNYLRHELLPQLLERQPGLKTILARSANHFAESSELLDELAEQDLVAIENADNWLSISDFVRLSPARQRNLLRHWLRKLRLPVPDSRNLQRVFDELIPAGEDAEPLVHWPGAEIRRYRERLFAMSPLGTLDNDLPTIPWTGKLPTGLGSLQAQRVQTKGISEAFLQREVTIGWRQGGERLAPPGRGGRHSLKKLYQEAAIPPWERQRRPLIFIDGELAQVAGLWTDSRFACGENEQGIQFEWRYAIEKTGENDDN